MINSKSHQNEYSQVRNFPKLTEEEMPNPEADIEIVPQLEHCKSRHHNVWLGEWTTDCLVILSIFSSNLCNE